MAYECKARLRTCQEPPLEFFDAAGDLLLGGSEETEYLEIGSILVIAPTGFVWEKSLGSAPATQGWRTGQDFFFLCLRLPNFCRTLFSFRVF